MTTGPDHFLLVYFYMLIMITSSYHHMRIREPRQWGKVLCIRRVGQDRIYIHMTVYLEFCALSLLHPNAHKFTLCMYACDCT